MAQGVGSSKPMTGHAADVFGGKLYDVVDYNGPTSYVQGGDAIDPRAFGFPNAILTLISSIDQTNTYETEARSIQKGITPWQLVWFVIATGLEVANGTNLSGFTVKLSGIGI